MQTTESRVKGLRYEANLKYPPVEEKYIEWRILYALARSQFEAEKQTIKFIIEDTYVRYALQARLKYSGAIPDNSFNREIIKVNFRHLADLLEELYGKEIAKSFMKDFKELIKKDSKVTFSEIRKNFVMGAAKGLGGIVVKTVKTILMPEAP